MDFLETPEAAIELHDHRRVVNHLETYRNPATRFTAMTPLGSCKVTPLGFLIVTAGYNTAKVLKVLVENAVVDLSAPYEIVDLRNMMVIHTNALTHLLALWDCRKEEDLRREVLESLIQYGADATAPALFEVLSTLGEPPEYVSRLSAGSGQSLMAFQMTQALDVPTSLSFVMNLVDKGKARFLPTDPPALFAGYVQKFRNPEKALQDVMDELCPKKYEAWKKIAGGILHRGEIAQGELLRVVQGLHPASGMNLLHLYAAYANDFDAVSIAERLRMARDVYGLNLRERMLDGRNAMDLAAASTAAFAQCMRQAIRTVIQEEDWHRAVVAAQSLRVLPHISMGIIGAAAGVPLQEAAEVEERVRARRGLKLNAEGKPATPTAKPHGES